MDKKECRGGGEGNRYAIGTQWAGHLYECDMAAGNRNEIQQD